MGPAAMIAAEAGGIGGHMTALRHEPHYYTIFYVEMDALAAYLQKSKIARRKNDCAAGGNSHRNVRLDARRGKND